MNTPITDSLTDNSARDNTGDKINGAEVDANPNILAGVLDGTTETMLNQDTGATDGLRIRNPEFTDISGAGLGVQTAARFRHDPPSGIVGDNDGVEVLFQGDNDAGGKITYAEIEALFTDVSNGTEDASLIFKTMTAGSSTTALTLTSAVMTVPAGLVVDTTTLVVDAANNRVGFGNNAPVALAHVGSGTDTPSYGTPQLLVMTTGTALQIWRDATNDVEAYLNVDTSGVEIGSQETGDYFYIGTQGSAKVAVSPTGDFGVGDLTPNYLTHFAGSDADYITRVENSHASTPDGLSVFFSGAAPNDTTQKFYNGVDTSSEKFIVFSSGTVHNATGTYTTISDPRAKDQDSIKDATPKTADLKRVRVINYELKTDPGKSLLGFDADNFEAVFPSLVREAPIQQGVDVNGDPVVETLKTVAWSVLVPMLVKGFQELEGRVTTLEAA